MASAKIGPAALAPLRARQIAERPRRRPADPVAALLLLAPFVAMAMLLAARPVLRQPIKDLSPVAALERLGPAPPAFRRMAAGLPALALPQAAPEIARNTGEIRFARLTLPASAPEIAAIVVPPPAPGEIVFARLALATKAPAIEPGRPATSAARTEFAALLPEPALPELTPPPAATLGPAELATAVPPGIAPERHVGDAMTRQCNADPAPLQSERGTRPEFSADTSAAGDFGRRLAAAATAQTADVVIYNARYTRIAYPMGDVSPFYGVCTDVVIRAYRALGVDLQVLVHASRPGGDANIDHRRTEMLRRFLAQSGDTLAASGHAEDFLPGDIVTYYRPQNRTSTAHIAIVTGVIAPSGRPLIVHNRGWGVQLEDALFVDQMTGHYRFAPPAEPAQVAARRLPAHQRLSARIEARHPRHGSQQAAGAVGVSRTP